MTLIELFMEQVGWKEFSPLLGPNVEILGVSCASCRGNLIQIHGRNILIKLCDTCGWISIHDLEEDISINRSVETYTKKGV